MSMIHINRLKEQGFSKDQIDEILQGIEENLNVGYYLDKGFSALQMHQIRLGLLEGLDVDVYARTEYDWFQMEELRKGLTAGVDIRVFSDPAMPHAKAHELRKGLEKGHDISTYLSYDAGIMREYRKSLESGVDIRKYLEQGYSADQLEQIRLSLEADVPIESFLSREYCGAALQEIRRGLEDGLDVTGYASLECSWKKMKEIRLGLLYQLDVSLYDNKLFTWQQMHEIRIGLMQGVDVSQYCRLCYTAAEMRRIRYRLLEELRVTAEKKTRELIQEEDYSITFSQGNMEAFFSYCGDPQKLTKKKVISLLNKNKIYHGILEDVIEEIVKKPKDINNVLVARGALPQNGTDGWFEFFFRTNLDHTPKILEDGSADYFNIDWFETVTKGQKLAYYHEATKGVDGCSVCGEVLKARNGIEKNVLKGSGFRIDEDRKTYYATLNGKIDSNSMMMNITNHIRVDEVTLATGNLVFDGSVHILGRVENGMTVDVTGDIEVDGYVGGATLRSGGSIFLKKGMNANNKGGVYAKGNVVSRYFEAVDVVAEGDIRFHTAMNCNFDAKGLIISTSVLVGGVAKSAAGFQLHDVGNDAWIPTDIRVIHNPTLFEEFFEKNKLQKDIEHELEILKKHESELIRKFTPKACAEMEIFTKLENAIFTKQGQMKELQKTQKTLDAMIRKIWMAKVVIMGQAFVGVHVTTGTSRFQADNHRNIVIQVSNGQVIQR